MTTVEGNREQIQANRKKIFELENKVGHNRALAIALRSSVNENTARINANYQAAWAGNRQLANFNTDDVFRNRVAIIRNIDARSPVEVNYKEALLNRTKLEFLAHRVQMNERVLENSQLLAAANRSLIDVNRRIMDGNEHVAQFNADLIAKNARLLETGIDARTATKDSNADLIAANKKLIEEIAARSSKNSERIRELTDVTDRNRTALSANTQTIRERRERILANHAKIEKNQGKVAEFISKL